MVIKRGISFRNTFQFIIKVNHNFSQRHVVIDLHTITGNIFLLHQFTTFTQTQGHDRTDIICGCDNGSTDIRLLNMVDQSRIGHTSRVMHLCHMTLFIVNIIRNVRHSGYHIHVKFTVKSLLHNLHVQQSQESATESEAQRQRGFRLESQ